mmetsp:Transcript_51502/g.164932  ORF Transcript_51502/g.164932 Transcript_51502/m.164932 type:complete len:254 (-) Transcript_51502:34-795(-)
MDEWCYVSSRARCEKGTMDVYTMRGSAISGTSYMRSNGPCTDNVDSRSQPMLIAFEVMKPPVVAAKVLGLLVLLLCGSGILLHRMPTRSSDWLLQEGYSTEGEDSEEEEEEEVSAAKHRGGAEPAKPSARAQPREVEVAKPRGSAQGREAEAEKPSGQSRKAEPLKSMGPLELRFEEAQREVVRKLTDTTPEDLKSKLYGLYWQAEHGDATGADKPSHFNRRERAKYHAWEANKGMSREEAIAGYVRAVDLLE